MSANLPDLQAPKELAEAMRSLGVADVDVSSRRRAEYSSDASNYRLVPAAVVFPQDADEVLAVLRVCREAQVPLTARGGGTSIAGNSVGRGVVLDFSRHMRRVLSVDAEAGTVVVQPGAVLDAITAAAAGDGLRFGPDPSSHARATIGGSIGNNACGSRALRYGRTSDNVVELEVLTAAGQRLRARRFGRGGLTSTGTGDGCERLLGDLDGVLRSRLDLVRTEFGRFRRQVSGYSLEHLLPENGVDLAAMLVGTEGTLGITVQAVVKLVAEPAATALAVLGYPDMAAAADATPGLLKHQPVALEGMDAALVQLLRDRRGGSAVRDLPRGGGWLLVETSGADAVAAEAVANEVVRDSGCLDSMVLTGGAAQALWRIREDGAGLGGRTVAGVPAWPGWEDAAVPPDRLGPYLREFGGLLDQHGLDALVYGHFGDGCVHARIDFPLEDRPQAMRSFVTEAATLAGRYGGSMSGEHGDGRARGELLGHMYSAEALNLMAAVKQAFDPQDLLNPGVIVRPAPLDADLRVPAAGPLRGLGFAYPHDDGDFTRAVHRCVGVGKCRADTTGSSGVMCPSYLATRDEKDSTRGRARVLQEMANGSLVHRGWHSPEVAEVLDLCLSCKGCAADCPAGVDMATYKAEALYQRYRRRLRPRSHYSLGWLPRWAAIASRFPAVANAAMSTKGLAALGKHAAGVDPRRDLPRFARQTFRSWFEQNHAGPQSGDPVLLWVDTFTNHFTPGVGIAAVKVLQDAGFAVQLTAEQVCCGLTWISTGQLDCARRKLRESLDALGPALDDGVPIVGLEPSCTAVFRGDAADLLAGDPRAVAAKRSTRTLAELLAARPGWSPPSLEGVRAVAQPHCHQHAVMGWSTDAGLLARAGAEVNAVGGCCGLAGNFGVEKGHYEVSVAVAGTALLPAVAEAGDDALLLADGFSCRTQLDQLAGRDSMHLAELLASRLPT